MLIGKFQKQDNDFIGEINTLGLTAHGVVFEAVQAKNDKAPDFIVHIEDSAVGAAWKKTSKDNKAFLSVKLDGPTFAAPIQCALVKTDDAYHLAWSRTKPGRKGDEPSTGPEF